MADFPVLNIPKVINAAFDRVGSRGILPRSIKGAHLAEGTLTSSRLGTYLRFTTDIVFSSTDEDTAAWTTGTINWSDGTTTETIVAGNTGNITATTYVYYDGAITGELQTTTTPASAVGDKKILIAIVETGAAGKDCKITTIGAAGLVVSNITTNQIQANTLVVGNMASSVSDRFFTDSTRKANIEAWRHATDATLIDGGDIYTGSVTTTQLNFVPVQSTDVIAKINASAEGITIEADNIAISGSTTFSAGYDPAAKVDEVAGTYASAASGARVLIFPDANTGIQVIDDAAADVFKCVVGGANVGDVVIGNYSGNQGAMWDKSAGTFNVRGGLNADDITAGTLSGIVVQTSGTNDRVVLSSTNNNIRIYDSSGTERSQVRQFDLRWLQDGGAIAGNIGIFEDTKELFTYSAGDAYYRVPSGQVHKIQIDGTDEINISAGVVSCKTQISTGYSIFIGDDSYIRDINVANTFGVYGQQSGTWGYAKTYITDPCSRKYKKNIAKVNDKKCSEILEEIKNLEVVTYKLKDSKIEEKTRLGIIAEDAPKQLVSPDGEGVVLSEYVNFLAAGLKALAQEVAELRS